ncbi:MAG TPA: lysozyme inhibitor LprI family protein [Xanthobacteraceae bacterium]|nr:lysozyme inhibitor LprI family protein [Xanthobacteraceae bacterium]
MIVGCAVLVIAAILLPALLLNPLPKVEPTGKAPAPTPLGEASGPLPAESTRLPPVAQLPVPPLSGASGTNTPPDQVAGNPSGPARPVVPPEATGTVDAGTPREAATLVDQTVKSSNEVAAVAPNEPKDAAKSIEDKTTSPANAPVDGMKPPDHMAILPPSETNQPAKPEKPTVASTENTSSGGVEPSEQSAARVPSEPTTGAGADIKMPTVEPPLPNDIGAAPEAGESSTQIAGINPDTDTATGRARDETSTPTPPTRLAGRMRTPWWCSNPRGDDVAAICGNGELLALDSILNALYSKLMARERSAELRNTQRQWLAERQSCGADIPCLKRHYEKRIDELARM